MAKSSTLELFTGCPVDPQYKNVPDFASREAQTAWFNQYRTYTENNMSYLRRERETVQIKAVHSAVYNANACRITNQGEQPFYGLITETRYINENCTEIVYDVDVWQSFMFDVNIGAGYIQRDHAGSDWNGSLPSYNNLEAEPWEPKDYKFTNITTKFYTDWQIVVYYTSDPDGTPVPGGTYGTYYSGAAWRAFPARDYQAVNDFLMEYVNEGRIDSIVQITMIPYPESNVRDLINIPSPTTVDGYSPANAKLLTYPYTYLQVTDSMGNVVDYSFELGNSGSLDFAIEKFFNSVPEIRLIPIGYRLNNSSDINWDEGASIQDFPQCTYNIDTYKNWLNNQGISTIISGSASIAAGIGIGLVNPLIGAATAVKAAADLTGTLITASKQAPQLGGAPGGPTTVEFVERYGFEFKIVQVVRSQAERIDGSFSRYGYAINNYRAPNLRTRQNYNFVKALDIELSGPVHNRFIAIMKDSFERGITFWHMSNGARVGDYEMGNPDV